jgi:glycosyltransferase involved in cell wall biosynthesis
MVKRGPRVAYITHYADLYGANRSLLDLMLALREDHGVVPSVILPRSGDLTRVLDELGIPWSTIPFLPWLSEPHASGGPHHRVMQFLRQRREARARSTANRELWPTVEARLKAWQVSIVHVNSAAVGIAPVLVERSGRPVVWHIRELPEAHYGTRFDGGGGRYARALRKVDRIIGISDAVAADVRLRTRGQARVSMIHDGVSTSLFQAGSMERRAATRERPFTFIQVGLIHRSKGQAEAVEALAMLRGQGVDARSIIVGGGRDTSLRARIAELRMEEHVELRGFMPDPTEAYREADALLMCSRHEALGRATIEAMCMGIPVIGHRSGGTVEVLESGRAGLLYDGGAEELCARMHELVTNGHLRTELARAGRDSVRERFDPGRSAKEVMEVYNDLME